MKSPLEISAMAVAKLTRTERRARVETLIDRAKRLVVEAEATQPNKEIVAKAVLFSGGNDSTVLLHLMHTFGLVTHTVHANTGIGIEATRQFVRDVSQSLGLPLIEEYPPLGCSYREMVLTFEVNKHGKPVGGFPGPAQHWKMYQRLKERCLDQARGPLGVHRSRKRRALYIAGRRREESKRREDVPLYESDGSVIWVSPLAEWTKLDLNTYRLMFDVPLNEVTSLLHMSGECLCGAFAKVDELVLVGDHFPEIRKEIEELEALLENRSDIPIERRTWGWGAYRNTSIPSRRSSKTGRLCNSCKAPGGEGS